MLDPVADAFIVGVNLSIYVIINLLYWLEQPHDKKVKVYTFMVLVGLLLITGVDVSIDKVFHIDTAMKCLVSYYVLAFATWCLVCLKLSDPKDDE